MSFDANGIRFSHNIFEEYFANFQAIIWQEFGQNSVARILYANKYINIYQSSLQKRIKNDSFNFFSTPNMQFHF